MPVVDDWFRSLFAEGSALGLLPFSELLLHLLCAYLLGQLVAWVYVWTHHGTSYSRGFVQSIVLLDLVVTVVILAVGNNIAGAIGLFGALALIRFRTPIKDTRDTAFLFVAVGAGIAVGSRSLMLALLGTGFALAVAMFLFHVRFGDRLNANAVLRFLMPAQAEQEGRLRHVLQHYCHTFALMHLRDAGPGATMEFSYRVQLDDPRQSSSLLNDLGAIPGMAGVMLLMQNEDVET